MSVLRTRLAARTTAIHGSAEPLLPPHQQQLDANFLERAAEAKALQAARSAIVAPAAAVAAAGAAAPARPSVSAAPAPAPTPAPPPPPSLPASDSRKGRTGPVVLSLRAVAGDAKIVREPWTPSAPVPPTDTKSPPTAAAASTPSAAVTVAGSSVLRATAVSTFPTVYADCLLSSGRWYYEVAVADADIRQIGWSTAQFKATPTTGVGDDAHSYGFDGNRYRTHTYHHQHTVAGAIVRHLPPLTLFSFLSAPPRVQ
jgi:hypothetical protein